MEEIKPVLTEEDDFEYRDKSTLLALFGMFGLSEIKTNQET